MDRKRNPVLFCHICCILLLLFMIASSSLEKQASLAAPDQNETILFLSSWDWGNYDKPTASVSSCVPIQYDLDGSEDILVGSYDSNAYIISGSTGETLFTFSKPRFSVDSVVWGDFAGNASKDLLIGASDNSAYLVDGATNRFLWKTPEEYPSGSVSAATGSDRDGDGQEEVFIASEDGLVYGLEGNTGNLIWISDTQMSGKPTKLIAADIDLDGVSDIIAGTDRGVYAFSGVDGSMIWSDNSSFTITDLMLNPLFEHQGAGLVYSTLEGYVIGLNGSSGEILWNTSVSLGTIWDIDYGVNDYGGPICLFAGSEDGNLYIMTLESGEPLWSYNPQLGPIIGVYEVEMKSQYFSYRNRIRSNATLIATRDGYVTCVYRDGYNRIRHDLNEWIGNYEAPERIERIQQVKLNSGEVTDFIIFLQDSSMLALSGATGEPLWESPRPKGPITSIAVGENRIIAGSHDGGVYSISEGSSEGRLLFSLENERVSSVLIQDIDQDSSQEIIAGAENGLVIVYDSSSEIQRWNNTIPGPVAVLGIINSDNDAFSEVVVGSRNGALFVLDGETGAIDWVADDPEKDVVSLAIDDFDGDNDDEIAIGSDDSKVYCYDRTGNLLWVNSGLTNSINRLVAADLDHDGIADIGAGSYYNVSGIKGTTGEQLWRNPDPPGYVRAISQGDVNQDGQSDIVVGTYESIYAIDGRTGENIWSQKADRDVISIDSTDINLDGTPDFIAGTSSGNISLLDGVSGRIVDQIEVYHSVEVIRILKENDNAVEIILTDGSGIRSFNVGRNFSNATKTNSMPSDYTAGSSKDSDSNSPLITDSSSSFGWTAGIAIISLLILKQTRIRFKKRRGHQNGKAS